MRRTRSLILIVAILVAVTSSLAAASMSLAANATPVDDRLALHTAPDSSSSVTAVDTPMSYRVQPGDTLVGIAYRYDIPVAVLAATNGISDFEKLTVGQTLRIPVPAGEVVRVLPGDTLLGIAHRHDVPLAQLAKANGLTDFSRIFVGQALRIPVVDKDAMSAAPFAGGRRMPNS